jgi:hypothetical protein
MRRLKAAADSRRPLTMPALQQFVNEIVASNDSRWAWENYKRVVLSLQRKFGCRALLEVGGAENAPNY